MAVFDNAGNSVTERIAGLGPQQVTVTNNPPLSITTTALVPAAATVGTAYAAQALAATGGQTPYTWSASNLPNSMSINSATGVISGTPAAAGTFNFTVTLQDSSNPQQTTSQSLAITVNPPPLSITTTALVPAAATVGTAYAAQALAATGGQTPYTWSASNLPNSMSINSATGVISGTPAAAGTFNFTVTLQDSSNPQQTTSQSLAITVNPPPLSITTTALVPATATVGTAYTAQALAATGGQTPYTWSASNLPNSMSINSATGVISGTPAAAGTFNFTVTLQDSSNPQQTTSQSLAITVNPPPLSITTTALVPATATVGTAYTAQALAATGGQAPYTWSAFNLPNGMSINSATGVISGMPGAAGTYGFTVYVRDSGNPQQTASQSLAITVNPALSITTTALVPATATVGTAYTAQALAATGGQTPYTWSAFNLPNGMSINSATGVISGTPGAAGTFNFTVTLQDSGNPQQTTSQSLAITVNPALSITTRALVPATATVGMAYTAQAVAASGGQTPYTWSASNLPNGVSINSATGVISGTPAAAGIYGFTVYVRDSGNPQQIASQSLAITVNPALSITTRALVPATATVGMAYTAQAVAASGGQTPYTWSASNLPNGVSINSATGVISGTPAAAGTYGFTVYVRDSGNPQQTASQSLAITVSPAPPVVTSGTQSSDYGKAFSYQIQAAGVGPFTYSTGALPTGLSLDANSGLISGTFDTAGTFPVTIQATNSAGTGTGTLNLNVDARLTVTAGAGGSTTPTGVTYWPLGSNIAVTATPASGHFFKGWSGASPPFSDPAVVTMQPSMQLNANFVLASTAAGSYVGVIMADPAEPGDSGILRVGVTATGAFSGNMNLCGVTYPLTGSFYPHGSATIKIPRTNLPALVVTLYLDLSGAPSQIIGEVTNGSWKTYILAELCTIYTSLKPCPRAWSLHGRTGFGHR